MRLPEVPNSYLSSRERERNRTLEREDRRNRKVEQDVDIGEARLVITSPDGTRFSITVSNGGTIAATSI
jgi:hypothetical protein